jgi:hypothetical protein
MTKKELIKMKKLLAPGYIETIAKETKYSSGYVSMVLNGIRENVDILKAAVKMAENRKIEMTELTNKIKNL